MGYKLVLFDFDGVLVKSNHVHVKNIVDSFSELNVPLNATEGQILSYFGSHFASIIDNLLLPEYRTDDVRQMVCDRIQEKLDDADLPDRFGRISGLFEFLSGLKANGYVLGIASGNERKTLVSWVEALELGHFFDHLIASDDVECGKPAPDMIHLAMDLFGVDASDILFVGDAMNDVLMAKNAGVVSAVVLTGALTRDHAIGLGADVIVEDVTRLDL